MSPLHILRGAIQQHQLCPVQPGADRQTAQVMPDIQQCPQLSEQVDALSAVLPDIPRATLEVMVREGGDLDAIVSKVFKGCASEPPANQQLNMTFECATAVSDDASYGEECCRIATSTSLTSEQLKGILNTASQNDSQDNQAESTCTAGCILSFHKPESTNISTLEDLGSNYWSNLFSSEDLSGLCPACFNMINLTSNFCPCCGQLLKKNYRSL